MAATTSQKTSWAAAIAATLFIFACAADQIMMPLATSAIIQELKTDSGQIQLAIALLSLFAAPFYIAGGKLGDIHGKKKIYLAGLALISIGPLSVALAPNMAILIGGWSIIKGLGYVLAFPASMGLLIASYPDNAQRGQAFAMYGVGAALAALVGPLLMGICAEALSYRVPFVLLFLLLAVTIFLAARSMPETEKLANARIDWGGTVLNFLTIGSLILGSMLGGRYGWWLARRPFTLGDTQINLLGLSPAPWLFGMGIVLAAILLGRLYRLEEKGGRPLFSMKLFDNRTFIISWSAGLLGFILAGASPFIIPVFTQQALGFDSLQSGIVMVLFSFGSIALGFFSGKLLEHMQARTLMQVSFFIVVVGLVWLAIVTNVHMTLGSFALPMLILGAGWGVISSQNPNIQLSTLSAELQGEGSGFAETGKELGNGLGAAVIGSILFSMAMAGFVDNVARTTDIQLTSQERNEAILMLEDETMPAEAIQALSQRIPNLEELGRQAFVEGFQIALGVEVAIMLFALLVVSFIPRVDPKKIAAKDTREQVADIASRRL